MLNRNDIVLAWFPYCVQERWEDALVSSSPPTCPAPARGGSGPTRSHSMTICMRSEMLSTSKHHTHQWGVSFCLLLASFWPNNSLNPGSLLSPRPARFFCQSDCLQIQLFGFGFFPQLPRHPESVSLGGEGRDSKTGLGLCAGDTVALLGGLLQPHLPTSSAVFLHRPLQ